jgi:hypothetical protein
MRLLILLLALAIVAFSTFVTAKPTEEKRDGGSKWRIPPATDNQKRDGASTSNGTKKRRPN